MSHPFPGVGGVNWFRNSATRTKKKKKKNPLTNSGHLIETAFPISHENSQQFSIPSPTHTPSKNDRLTIRIAAKLLPQSP